MSLFPQLISMEKGLTMIPVSGPGKNYTSGTSIRNGFNNVAVSHKNDHFNRHCEKRFPQLCQ